MAIECSVTLPTICSRSSSSGNTSFTRSGRDECDCDIGRPMVVLVSPVVRPPLVAHTDYTTFSSSQLSSTLSASPSFKGSCFPLAVLCCCCCIEAPRSISVRAPPEDVCWSWRSLQTRLPSSSLLLSPTSSSSVVMSLTTSPHCEWGRLEEKTT